MRVLNRAIAFGMLLPLTMAGSTVWAQNAPASAAGDLSSMTLPDQPPGLGAQMAFVGVGAESEDLDCTFDLQVVGNQTCAIQVGSSKDIWFDGFDQSRDVQVSLSWPNGNVEKLVATKSADTPDDSTPMMHWEASTDKPQGTYAVEAVQGALKVTGTLTVSAPPAAYTITPSEGPPGTEFTISLTGFNAGQEIRLRIYRSLSASQTEFGGNYFYVASLGPIRADGNGNASYSVRTGSGDRTGNYVVETDPSLTYNPPGFSLLGNGHETPDQERTALVRSIVESADELWASVVADSGARTDVFGTVFGGDRLKQVQADISALRSAGQHIEAHPTAPVVVLSASGPMDNISRDQPGGPVDAVVQETLDMRRVNADGSLAASQSGQVVRHVVLVQDPVDNLWRIVSAEEVASP